MSIISGVVISTSGAAVDITETIKSVDKQRVKRPHYHGHTWEGPQAVERRTDSQYSLFMIRKLMRERMSLFFSTHH